MSKPTPAVVFINAFVEPEDKRWIIGDRDLTSYMERKMAFINKIEKENKKKNNDVNNNTYDLLTYMSRESAFISKAINITDEKDYGNFNATIDKFTEDDCNDFRKHERQTKQNGSPKYYGWGSFDNNFLIENGLMDIYGHLDYKRLRSYIRKSMNALITTSKKLDNDNVYWAASVHLNTDNVHLHFSMLEYEMREDRRKKYPKTKNMLEPEAFDKFKTTMVNSIMKDNKMFKQLTSFQREYLLPSVKEIFPKGTVDLLGELVSKLPTDKQWQYNRPKMKKYQPLIDDCVMSLIKNNPTAFDNYNKYLIKLDEAVEKLKHTYGTGKEERRLYDKFKINHLNEFRQRSGNALLNFLKEDNLFYDNAVNQYLSSDKNFDNIFIPENEYDFSDIPVMENQAYEFPNEPLTFDEPNIQQIQYENDSLSIDEFPSEENYIENIPYTTVKDDIPDLISDNKYYLKWSDNYKEACSVIYDKKSERDDFIEAEQLLLSEAKSGNVLAIHDLGKLYSTEKLGDKNDNKSFEYYKEALQGFMAIEPHAENMFPYEPMYEGQSMKPKDMRSYVWYRIGKMHCYGLGTDTNYEEAFKWFLKSSKMNNKFAQYNLANLYYFGNGVEKDLSQAFYWYMKSAEQDQPYAAYSVAQMYNNGEAVPKDEDKAQKYYKQALNGFLLLEKNNQADDNLFYKIGTMYKNGLGAEIDTLKAIDYFKQSAEFNNKNGLYEYGKTLLLGEHLPQDNDKAVQLLEKSINLGNTNAKRFLALEYISGKHLEQNIAKGIDMLAECVENGDMLACYNLGKIYFKGEVIEKDLNKAEKYFLTSAESENEFALYSLGKLYLEKEKYDLEKALMYLTKSTEYEKIKPYAEYSLGKTLYDKDIDKELGLNYLLSASGENVYACTKAAKILAYDKDFLDEQKTIELLTYAIEKFEDNILAKYHLGKILYDKDIDKESGLNYLLSASDENIYACTKAAKIMMYDNDFLNTEKTIELLTYAVGHFENNTIAKSMLGNIYLTKESFKQERTGLLLLDEAAAESDEFAQQILGKFYMQDGHKNLDKALSYLLPSAENGNAFSQYYIGKLYLSKEKRDIIKAKQFLSLSVSSGNQYAEYTLGCIYLKEGNNRDALKYLKKSAEHGNKYAKSLYNMVSNGKYKMRNKHHTYLRPSLPMLRRFYDSVNGHTRYLINQVQYEIEQKAEYDKLVEQQQIEYDIHRNY